MSEIAVEANEILRNCRTFTWLCWARAKWAAFCCRLF